MYSIQYSTVLYGVGTVIRKLAVMKYSTFMFSRHFAPHLQKAQQRQSEGGSGGGQGQPNPAGHVRYVAGQLWLSHALTDPPCFLTSYLLPHISYLLPLASCLVSLVSCLLSLASCLLPLAFDATRQAD